MGKDSKFSFHQFQKDRTLQKEWVIRIKRLDPKTKKLWEPKEWDTLCSKHFAEECFTSRTRLGTHLGLPFKAELLPDAIPTIFQHSEIARKRKKDLSDRRVSLAKRLQHRQKINMILTSVNNGEPSAVKVSQHDEKNSYSEDCCFQPQASGLSEEDLQNKFEVPATSKDTDIQPEAPGSSEEDLQNTVEVPATTKDADIQVKPTMTSQSQQTVQLCLHKEVQTDPDLSSDPERNFLKDELDTNTFLERKFIVHEKLEELLSVCRQCSNPSTITSKEECGTGVKFKTICQDSFCVNHYSWTSQPHSFRLPLGNIVLAAAAFFTACSPTWLITAFKHASITCLTSQTFF